MQQQDGNTTGLFIFTRDGFYTFVNMLTDEHRVVFKDLVKSKFQIDVELSQFINLIPAKFDCTMKLINDDGNDFLIKGTYYQYLAKIIS